MYKPAIPEAVSYLNLKDRSIRTTQVHRKEKEAQRERERDFWVFLICCSPEANP